MNTKHRIIT